MDALAPEDPSVTAFEARIECIDGRELVLDRTYFYAETGGQPADHGEIGDVAVVDVQERDGEIVHTIAAEAGFDVGETVSCAVDPAFRTYCMRAHTASHVLYGAGRRLLDDLGYGGFGIDERKVRIDFETSTEIEDATLVELERLTNRTVWESRPVTWETVPVEPARAREGVAFNTKTEEGVFGEGEGVPIVTIGASSRTDDTEWDSAACGGTHVSNTREIGPISVLDRSNPGEGLTRVELAVGPAAIDHRVETRTSALGAARELGVGVSDLPEEIDRRKREIAELEAERDDLPDRVADAQLDAIADPVERDGERWLVGTLAGVDGETLADRARARAGDDAEVVALLSDSDPVTMVGASAGETDASAVVDCLTTEFGGGGGGGPAFAQGGGIGPDPAEVASYLCGK